MALGASTYNDVATYWPPASQSGFGGVIYDAPQTIYTRWENRVEVFLDSVGNERHSRAVVYTLEALEIDGYLYLGESVVADPTSLTDAWAIQGIQSWPDLRGLNQLNRVFL